MGSIPIRATCDNLIRTWRSLVIASGWGPEATNASVGARGSNPAVLTDEIFSGRGADGSTPVLGTGGFRFDSGVPDFAW